MPPPDRPTYDPGDIYRASIVVPSAALRGAMRGFDVKAHYRDRLKGAALAVVGGKSWQTDKAKFTERPYRMVPDPYAPGSWKGPDDGWLIEIEYVVPEPEYNLLSPTTTNLAGDPLTSEVLKRLMDVMYQHGSPFGLSTYDVGMQARQRMGGFRPTPQPVVKIENL